jgi:hypothetical protein
MNDDWLYVLLLFLTVFGTSLAIGVLGWFGILWLTGRDGPSQD